jgi:hypothetical protein
MQRLNRMTGSTAKAVSYSDCELRSLEFVREQTESRLGALHGYSHCDTSEQQLGHENLDELYRSAVTDTEEPVLTYMKPPEATFSTFDFTPMGTTLEIVEETLPGCFVRRRCNDNKCFVDL